MEVDRSKRYAEASHVLSDLRNPDQVVVSRQRPERPGGSRLPRRLVRQTRRPVVRRPGPHRKPAAEASIILAGVDLSNGRDALSNAVLDETARLLRHARIPRSPASPC